MSSVWMKKQVRQNECCLMDAGISVIVSGIHIKRMEKDYAGTWNPIL